MAIEPEKIKAIFLAAVEKATPIERAVFVTEACAGDSACRRRLEVLLQAHDEPGGLLDWLPTAPAGSEKEVLADAASDHSPPETNDVIAYAAGPSTPPDADQQLRALYRLLAHSDPLHAAGGSSQPASPVVVPSTAPRVQDAASDSADAPAWRDQYELLGKIGRGGMGVVYKARQAGLNRLVALKTILTGENATADERARFRREAESMARLHHLHIVQVYAVGERDGCPFFSMELLEGGSLAQKIAGRPQPARQAAAWLEALARAMHYAHTQGVIHRDLKPGNVILTADGVPKITDFGLARQLHAEPGASTPAGQTQGEPGVLTPGGQTASGVAMGTAEYMAPEQAAGRSKEVGPLSDVYALGAILYELLTGRPPFRRDDYFSTLQEVQERDPPWPRTLNPQVDPELEAVCLKCLEKKPHDRYPSAEALADDLSRWQRGEPTVARPRRWSARVARTIRRHALLSMAVALPILAAVITMGVVAYLRDPARNAAATERRPNESQPLILIGETGQPPKCVWRTTEGKPRVLDVPDGTFTIQSEQFGLLELLPDPGHERYRFRAEVRQEFSEGKFAEMGIYVGYSQFASAPRQPPRTTHCFCGLTVNDNVDPTIPKRYVTTRLDLLREPDMRRSSKGTAGQRSSRPELFTPAVSDHGRGPWRKVAVEVTPESFRFFWEERYIDELPRTELVACAQRLLGKTSKKDQLPFTSNPGFAPRDALGLFVSHGAASFRRVVVEPLRVSN